MVPLRTVGTDCKSKWKLKIFRDSFTVSRYLISSGFSGLKDHLSIGQYNIKKATVLRRKAHNVFEKIQLENFNRFVILFPQNQHCDFVQKKDPKTVIFVRIK